MDLGTVAKVIAPLAPMVGSILGGLIPFPGGSMIGQKLGEMIARQFGVDPASPNAAAQVSDRIAEAGEETARAKINAGVEQARIQIDGFVAYERAVLEAQVKNLADVNATIRAEAENRAKYREHWFFSAWRPAIAWGFGSVYISFGVMLTVVTAIAAWRSPSPLETLRDAWPLFLAYFGPGGLVLGVLIPSRSIEKKAAIENAAPMPNAKLVVAPLPPSKAAVKPPPPPPIVSRDRPGEN